MISRVKAIQFFLVNIFHSYLFIKDKTTNYIRFIEKTKKIRFRYLPIFDFIKFVEKSLLFSYF